MTDTLSGNLLNNRVFAYNYYIVMECIFQQKEKSIIAGREGRRRVKGMFENPEFRIKYG